jgi:peptidoglycan/xylan/chitin deacetylase (PgdA/CDA1 family)
MTLNRQMVLNFHGIGTPPAHVDDSERPYWISEQRFNDIVALACQRDGTANIRWTFDDGNRSDFDIAAPALAKHGLTGTFFLLTGRLDDRDYLGPTEARSMMAMGMKIGLHGRDHLDWRVVTPGQLRDETVAARHRLADVTGCEIDEVAIPFGAYNRRIITHLKRCGFARINTSDGGFSTARQQICSRTSIRSDMSLERISQLMDDRLPPLRKLKRHVSIFVRRNLL